MGQREKRKALKDPPIRNGQGFGATVRGRRKRRRKEGYEERIYWEQRKERERIRR